MATNFLIDSAGLQTALTGVKNQLDALDAKNFGSVKLTDRTLGFYATDDTSGTPLITITLPSDLRLDQAKTTFVSSFTFNATTYPGATNPNLNGKPVLVLTVTDGTNTTYSFLNLEGLIKTYTAGNKGITISGASISANVSSTTDNLLSIDSNGLFVGHDASKVNTVAGAANNFVAFGANGAIKDSGYAVASTSDINSMLTNIFG